MLSAHVDETNDLTILRNNLPIELFDFLNSIALFKQKPYVLAIPGGNLNLTTSKPVGLTAYVTLRSERKMNGCYMHDNYLFHNKIWAMSKCQDIPNIEMANRSNIKFNFFAEQTFSDAECRLRTPKEVKIIIKRVNFLLLGTLSVAKTPGCNIS